ncbi:radical SAM/SPASM domain-containing protein [Candidatus Omnitrophota bacterium]
MVIINPASNLCRLAGSSVTERGDARFKEYRRLWTERPLNFSAGDFPLFLDIEVTNMCNYRCSFCATTYFEDSMKRGVIEPGLVRRIIDEGVDKGLYGVKFNDRGEPLLCGELSDHVRYAKKKGLVDVYFNTNGFLMDEDAGRWIVDSGLDRISVSIEGTTPEVYEKHREGGDFGRVFRNLSRLRELRDRAGSETPRIRVQTVLLKELEPDLGEYARFWSEIADEVCYIDYKEEEKAHLRGNIHGVEWACHQLWQRMVIWWDGTILPCNEDDRGRLTVGNVASMSIEEAWNSGHLRLLREKHKGGGSGEMAPCDKCYLRDSEIKKIAAGGEK